MTPVFYRTTFLVASAMLFLAIFEMPWGYYQALRWLIPFAGVLVFLRVKSHKNKSWIVLGVLSIIFFLPAFGVYFDKATWGMFDFAFAIAYLLASIRLAK